MRCGVGRGGLGVALFNSFSVSSSWDKPTWPWSVVLWNITRCPLNSREYGWNKCITVRCLCVLCRIEQSWWKCRVGLHLPVPWVSGLADLICLLYQINSLMWSCLLEGPIDLLQTQTWGPATWPTVPGSPWNWACHVRRPYLPRRCCESMESTSKKHSDSQDSWSL